MEDFKYLINGRFLLDQQLNCLKDIVTYGEHRLEPRLTAVLLELIKNSEAVVTRETLIQKIWNDYPGAEDGLNQAVSSLRKFLADDTKEIIRTIPKKGYMLVAPVVKQKTAVDLADKSKNKVLRYGVIVVIALTCVIALVWLVVSPENEPVRISQTKSTEMAFPHVAETESNYLNTITTTDSLGNRYRLVMIGDRRPKFYVNDSLLLDTEPYTLLVDKLAKELWRRQKEAEGVTQ